MSEGARLEIELADLRVENRQLRAEVQRLSIGLYRLLPNNCEQAKGNAVDTALARIEFLNLQIEELRQAADTNLAWFRKANKELEISNRQVEAWKTFWGRLRGLIERESMKVASRELLEELEADIAAWGAKRRGTEKQVCICERVEENTIKINPACKEHGT